MVGQYALANFIGNPFLHYPPNNPSSNKTVFWKTDKLVHSQPRLLFLCGQAGFGKKMLTSKFEYTTLLKFLLTSYYQKCIDKFIFSPTGLFSNVIWSHVLTFSSHIFMLTPSSPGVVWLETPEVPEEVLWGHMWDRLLLTHQTIDNTTDGSLKRELLKCRLLHQIPLLRWEREIMVILNLDQ